MKIAQKHISQLISYFQLHYNSIILTQQTPSPALNCKVCGPNEMRITRNYDDKGNPICDKCIDIENLMCENRYALADIDDINV